MNTSSQPPHSSTSGRIGPWGWFGLFVLGIFLACAVWYAAWAWGRLGGVDISPLGWFFLAAGAFFTLLVGGGLMALLFYSHRTGRDI